MKKNWLAKVLTTLYKNGTTRQGRTVIKIQGVMRKIYFAITDKCRLCWDLNIL